MFRSKKFLLSFLILTLASFAIAGFVFARELEVSYPSFNNTIGPSSTRTLLPDYVIYIFNFSVLVSGLIVLGVLIYAGFRYLSSAGNPTAMSDATGRIKDALIGMLIILGSYLLLTTINPQLVMINPILSTKQGVVLYKDAASCLLGGATPESQEDLRPERDYIKFGISSQSLEGLSGQAGSIWLYQPESELKVNLYPGENWTGDPVAVEGPANSCVNSLLSTAQSIELDWQNPGVYLCTDPTEKECSIYTANQAVLDNKYDDKVNYIKFKNAYTYDASLYDPEDSAKCENKPGGQIYKNDSQGNELAQPTCGYYSAWYGAVLHENPSFGGVCSINTDEFVPLPDNKGVSSVTVLLRDSEPAEGAEVVLCKYADCRGAECSTKKCDTDPGTNTEGASVILRYGDEPVPSEPKRGIYYDPEGKFFNLEGMQWQNPNMTGGVDKKDEQVAAIKVKGNLKPIMFRDNGLTGECEVLKGDYDPDLENNAVTGAGMYRSIAAPLKLADKIDSISSLRIILIKK